MYQCISEKFYGLRLLCYFNKLHLKQLIIKKNIIKKSSYSNEGNVNGNIIYFKGVGKVLQSLEYVFSHLMFHLALKLVTSILFLACQLSKHCKMELRSIQAPSQPYTFQYQQTLLLPLEHAIITMVECLRNTTEWVIFKPILLLKECP